MSNGKGNSLVNRIRQARTLKQLSIRQAATEMGMSHCSLARIEQGKMPDLTNLTKLCAWLNISTEVALKELGLLRR